GEASMVEIRFHGRGGQGTVMATILLAKAFFRDGYQVQSFPLFGVERRGAPVEAYLRLDQTEILIRTHVYTPDHVVVLDQTLLESIDVTVGLKKSGWILINRPSPPANLDSFSDYRLAVVDATHIALKNRLGTRTQPIVNTAVMGSLARVLGIPSMAAISEAIREEIPRQPKANIKAAESAYQKVKLLGDIEESIQGGADVGSSGEVKLSTP
ncbi:MAG: 2-oxoacid:acceptor oxidoreductase family protein, partial [Syntrophobacteria bacterium]